MSLRMLSLTSTTVVPRARFDVPAPSTIAPAPPINDAPNHVDAERVTEARVRIQSSNDIVASRRQVRALALRAGFSNSNVTMITTAVSEVARNIVEYANEGEITLRLVNHSDKRGIQIIARDNGPGIPDVSIAMRDGYSTSHGLGMGLPGARRLMHEFSIESVVGEGTTIRMTKWVRTGTAKPSPIV
jgi:serine/threonine-protein kinase RsbT